MSRIALEPIANGVPVRETEEGVRAAASYAEMTGVARRAFTDSGWAAGEEVSVRTDGGILTILPWPLSINGGRYTRSAYCTLSNGKICDAH